MLGMLGMLGIYAWSSFFVAVAQSRYVLEYLQYVCIPPTLYTHAGVEYSSRVSK